MGSRCILSSHSMMLGIDPKALHVLGRHSTTELYGSPFILRQDFVKFSRTTKSSQA